MVEQAEQLYAADHTGIVQQLLKCIASTKTLEDLQFVSQVIADYKHSKQSFLTPAGLDQLRAAVISRSKVLNV